jgi:hypothetical protein
MANRTQKYHQAAIAYLVYGVLYLAGALYLGSVGVGPGGGVVWYIVGAVVVLVFPLLIWKGFKWFTRILAGLILFRIAGLIQVILRDSGEGVPMPWGGTLPVRSGALILLLIAGVTCFMLIRAGWEFQRRRAEV